MKPRLVFDTTTVLSALVFATGRLAWLRFYWQSRNCVPLVSAVTAAELTRVLAYPKFRLSADDRAELLGDYLPFCEVVRVTRSSRVICRDIKDQPFLDLAHSGRAEILISSDHDLLALAGKTPFRIEAPEAYRVRVFGAT